MEFAMDAVTKAAIGWPFSFYGLQQLIVRLIKFLNKIRL
jgi:hypothetical protein